jgi:ADP-heptose:LPS heptosyltransferase
MRQHVLVARLDNAGDVLLAGPAIRAVATGAREVTLLAGPRGAAAAALLPGVDRVLVHRAAWIDPEPEPVHRVAIEQLMATVRDLAPEVALILTSFHQSPLPLALLLRLAGVEWVGAVCDDYPGSLLDLRHHVDDGVHEVERGRSLARAAGFDLPPGDDGALRVELGAAPDELPEPPYVVVHPGASVPARAWPAEHARELVRLLEHAGRRVVVTGGPGEEALTRLVAGEPRLGVEDLGGRTGLAAVGHVLAAAEVAVCGNTGPAHLAAAVGTPVVSLFAPTVPVVRWRPWRVPQVLHVLDVPCADCRARVCPVPGHPCLRGVAPAEVAASVEELASRTLAVAS